jgi:hypothetical protein
MNGLKGKPETVETVSEHAAREDLDDSQGRRLHNASAACFQAIAADISIGTP